MRDEAPIFVDEFEGLGLSVEMRRSTREPDLWAATVKVFELDDPDRILSTRTRQESYASYEEARSAGVALGRLTIEAIRTCPPGDASQFSLTGPDVAYRLYVLNRRGEWGFAIRKEPRVTAGVVGEFYRDLRIFPSMAEADAAGKKMLVQLAKGQQDMDQPPA